MQCRHDQNDLIEICQAVSDADQWVISQVEFGLLSLLEFDCQLPLGVNVRKDKTQLVASVFIATSDLDRQADFEFGSYANEPVHTFLNRVGGVITGWLKANSE